MKIWVFRGFQVFLFIALIGIPGLLSFDEDFQVLGWHTFIGSPGEAYSWAIAVDGSGNVYVAGQSDTTWGTPVNPFSGGYEDAFVAKFDNNGVLQWHTFMGSYNSSGYGIAVDGSGNVYVIGVSDDSWGTPINDHAGYYDVFVAKLNSSGILQWHTFMGSSDLDWAEGIAVDGIGNVYVVGWSYDPWGTPINPYNDMRDAFAAKLDNNGIRQWNTFLGSVNDDYGNAIAVESSGYVYVAGSSAETWGTPINPYNDWFDAFAVKLDNSGTLQWNTFLGSEYSDEAYGLDVDASGNIYISGYSAETWGTPVNPYAGISDDAFAAKLNSSGIRQWHTFMGSTHDDTGNSIAVGGNGKVYVAGSSMKTWGTPIYPYTDESDVFAAELNNSGVRQWHTFMGSSDGDRGYGVAVDGSGNVYITGDSGETWGTPVNPHGGGFRDGFVAKIDVGGAEPEINVRFGAINFADGSTRNLGTRPSSFIMGREFSFTIENLGGAPLNLTGSPMVTLSGPQSAHFYISQQPTSPVAALDSTIFKLRTVRDSLPGILPIGWTYPVSFTVNIPNDDADENPYDFTINFTLEKD